MKFIPSEDFYIITNLAPAEVQLKLEKEIAPASSFRMRFGGGYVSNDYPGASFRGYIFNGIFEIERVITYRNSFNPQIKGEIMAYEQGSRIHIKMTLPNFAMVFICIWLGFVGIAFIFFLINEIIDKDLTPVVLVPLGMFLFGYLLAMGGFKFESKDCINTLFTMFEGDTE